MMMPDIGDIIELIKDVPEKSLRAGMRGAVVHRHSDDVYEVEFTDDNGETLDFLRMGFIRALPTTYFIVVWRAETHQWIPIAEQTSALVAHLPDDAAKEVLDFARFLAVRINNIQ